MSSQLHGLTVREIREKARSDSQRLLSIYWPRGVLPIDPIFLARQLGVSVFTAQLGDDTWGMLIGSDGGADIYVDVDQPETRLRFSCAHELGHFVDRQGDLSTEQAYVDRRSDAGKGDADEIYANEFAGSLLMPADDLFWAIQRGESNWDLADRFKVSTTAVAYRRKLLGMSAGPSSGHVGAF